MQNNYLGQHLQSLDLTISEGKTVMIITLDVVTVAALTYELLLAVGSTAFALLLFMSRLSA